LHARSQKKGLVGGESVQAWRGPATMAVLSSPVIHFFQRANHNLL
jgi:hypothetical protein